jgi:D-3-phosphoglycerate dehydrogenase / 2-oxoglutarate reductase
MPKVLISDKMSPRAAEIFQERGIEVDVKPGMTPEELKACIGEYDGLAVRSATKAKVEIIEAGANLKVIGRAGIGVDNIDIAAATQRGIVVMNTPFGNSITTAEHAISLMLALARHIPQANASTHQGKWEKSRFMGVELMGKTLGIIGCGNVGAVTADRAQGLKMKVVACDPYLSVERAGGLGVEKVELDQLLARSDFISLHTPMTDATRDIVNADTIAKMKPGVRIVNTARGGLIVEADLKAALESGQVAAAAVDVFPEEPATENILFGMDNVIATPHLGASTTEAQEKVALQVAEQMADFLLTGAVANALNMPSMTPEEAPRLKPYMKLAQQLGGFAGQLTENAIRAVSIEFEGAAAELNTRPLASVALQGLLSPVVEAVNTINAPLIAKDRNIAISEVKHERRGDFATLMRVTVTTGSQTHSVAGTVLVGDRPRLVEVQGIRMEAELAPFMLFVTNRDKPGVVGDLGAVLGAAGINIATLQLGRTGPGGDAICLFAIDAAVSDEVVEKVRAIEHVTRARGLAF